MFLNLEKEIIRKDFIEIPNEKRIWSFGRSYDHLAQITLEYLPEKNKYKFAFPMSNNTIHYAIYFLKENTDELGRYVKHVLNNYI